MTLIFIPGAGHIFSGRLMPVSFYGGRRDVKKGRSRNDRREAEKRKSEKAERRKSALNICNK